VYGAAETIGAVGVFSYQVAGTALYGAGLSDYHEKTALEFWGGIDALSERVETEGLKSTALDVALAPVDRVYAGLEAGDAFEAGAGVGNLATEALVVVEGVQSLPRISITVSPARAVAFAGGAGTRQLAPAIGIAVAGGGGDVAAVPGVFMAKATRQGQGRAQGQQSGSETATGSEAQASTAKPARTGAKRGPKPKATGPHNETIERRIRQLEAEDMTHRGGGVANTEEVVRTPGGKKTSRRPDITMERPDGTLYRENVGRTRASGEPVTREVDALDDLERQLGERPGFTPYEPKPKKQ